jgi:hypothetical protein
VARRTLEFSETEISSFLRAFYMLYAPVPEASAVPDITPVPGGVEGDDRTTTRQKLSLERGVVSDEYGHIPEWVVGPFDIEWPPDRSQHTPVTWVGMAQNRPPLLPVALDHVRQSVTVVGEGGAGLGYDPEIEVKRDGYRALWWLVAGVVAVQTWAAHHNGRDVWVSYLPTTCDLIVWADKQLALVVAGASWVTRAGVASVTLARPVLDVNVRVTVADVRTASDQEPVEPPPLTSELVLVREQVPDRSEVVPIVRLAGEESYLPTHDAFQWWAPIVHGLSP